MAFQLPAPGTNSRVVSSARGLSDRSVASSRSSVFQGNHRRLARDPRWTGPAPIQLDVRPMKIAKVVVIMREYFPEIDDDLDSPYLYASNVADWYAKNCDDPAVVNRMKNFFTIVSKYPAGESAKDDLGTIVQVGIIEKLWRQENAAQCLSTLFTAEDLASGAEYYKQWIGEARYNVVIAGIKR